MMHNNLIDNSSDALSMQNYIKRCILAEGIDKIQIATGYWDIPGMALVLSELTSFLERDGTSLELLIGKDPVVYTSLLANPKYKDASYPYDFIRTDIHDLKIKDEYKSVINLLLQYCGNGKMQIRIYKKNANDEVEFLHSKCYIFSCSTFSYGIIGSSNFTQKGLLGNAELNYLEADPDQAALVEENRKTMLTPFTDSTMDHKITYHNRFNDDIVELCYQHTYNRRSGEVHTATTEQRPDIVLNIQKADGFVLTYLYDAKYRVLDDTNKDIDNLEDDYYISDYPPPDALNQMHRYRDAIYYGCTHFKHIAKEIIGGYILFPGRYRKEKGSESPYYIKSIKEVNIGAFPLLPNGEQPEEEGKMLRDHLVQILRTEERYEQIKDSIPQKGLTYTIVPDDSDLVLVGYYKSGQLEPIKKNKLYYVRAGMDQGSLRLTAGFEHCHYVLLHNKQSQELYKLTTNGPRIVSGRQLQAKGFDVQREFYLVFDLESTEPIIYVHKPDGSTFKVKQSKTPYAKDPYFMTLTELLE